LSGKPGMRLTQCKASAPHIHVCFRRDGRAQRGRACAASRDARLWGRARGWGRQSRLAGKPPGARVSCAWCDWKADARPANRNPSGRTLHGAHMVKLCSKRCKVGGLKTMRLQGDAVIVAES
jgi:hypothetical protein